VEGPGRPEDAAVEERALQQAAEQFREALDRSGLSQALESQIRIEVTREGLRIELIERDNSPFFRVGSPAVLPTLRPVLENLVRVVAKLPNPITVEGHTDSRRYSDEESYSNWELSADRTNSARRVMEAAGLTPGRIDRVVGHADRMPLLPGDRLNAMNRRITILVRRQTPGPDAALDALQRKLAPSGGPRS
jgi:chemotaxis protein MotB